MNNIDEKSKIKETYQPFENIEEINKLDNTAKIEEDYFDSKSFNFSNNFNFAENNDKNLFVNNLHEYGSEEKPDHAIELNKYNLPIKGFARIIEKQLFCNILF